MAAAATPDKPNLGAPDKHAAALRQPDLSRHRKRMIRTLRHLVLWGGAAAIAMIAVGFSALTPEGSKRLQTAWARLDDPAALLERMSTPPMAPEISKESAKDAAKDIEIKRLDAQVHALTIDRDRLASRIAGLERSLEDTTGSIKKQVDRIEAQPPAKAVIPILAPLAMAPTPPTSGWTDAPVAVAATEPAAQAAPLPPSRPELGIDLGSARTIDILNARWLAVKANFGPMLTGMHPLAVNDTRPGFNDIRLLVGPLPNGAAAAQLCARFAAVKVTCRATKFVGEPLTVQ